MRAIMCSFHMAAPWECAGEFCRKSSCGRALGSLLAVLGTGTAPSCPLQCQHTAPVLGTLTGPKHSSHSWDRHQGGSGHTWELLCPCANHSCALVTPGISDVLCKLSPLRAGVSAFWMQRHSKDIPGESLWMHRLSQAGFRAQPIRYQACTPSPSLPALCASCRMQGGAGAHRDALWALSSGQHPGSQHTPPAMPPSAQGCKPRAGLDANTNTTLHCRFWDNSSTESPCCWSTKPWDRAGAQEGSLACRDCSDARALLLDLVWQ